MKKLLLTFIFFFISSLFIFPNTAKAYQCNNDITIEFSQNPVYLDQGRVTIRFTVNGNLNSGSKYFLDFLPGRKQTSTETYYSDPLIFEKRFTLPADVKVSLVLDRPWPSFNQPICTVSDWLVLLLASPMPQCNVTFSKNPADLNDTVAVSISNLDPSSFYDIILTPGIASTATQTISAVETNSSGNLSATFNQFNRIDTYSLVVKIYGGIPVCTNDDILTIEQNVPDPIPISCSSNDTACINAGCTCKQVSSLPDDIACMNDQNEICYTTSGTATTGPKHCNVDNDPEGGIQTALGCLPIQIGPFVNNILTKAISIGAGLAFLLMLFGAFTLITSAGNPENIQKGKEIITSAIIGLLFIIFSVFLLKLIGVDILQIPGFNAP